MNFDEKLEQLLHFSHLRDLHLPARPIFQLSTTTPASKAFELLSKQLLIGDIAQHLTSMYFR